jgi:phosphate/sulfate permease
MSVSLLGEAMLMESGSDLNAGDQTIGTMSFGKRAFSLLPTESGLLLMMFTIAAADYLGLPVRTTHVLSSGIAGAMTANGSAIQKDTV